MSSAGLDYFGGGNACTGARMTIQQYASAAARHVAEHAHHEDGELRAAALGHLELGLRQDLVADPCSALDHRVDGVVVVLERLARRGQLVGVRVSVVAVRPLGEVRMRIPLAAGYLTRRLVDVADIMRFAVFAVAESGQAKHARAVGHGGVGLMITGGYAVNRRSSFRVPHRS